MGMFDSVIVPCPACGGEVEFQSKAGECRLRRYHVSSVPMGIAADLNNTSEKCDCGEFVTITMGCKDRVSMRVVDEEYD